MKEIRDINKVKSIYNEDVEIDLNVCSTTDCTGLIPSLPQSEAELESYKDILQFEVEARVSSKDSDR